ncbi:hypothetical protein FRB91_002847 [Serendipita sp. 411]|nr:hypothetical protein FRB91_002847 [Serendipita sp. 411]
MYEPNVFTLNLEQLMSGVPLDTAIGVLQITIISASGIKANKIGGGTPDPYASIAIGNNLALERTSPRMDTRTPVWNETKFVLVSALTGDLNLSIWDFNEHRKDHELGKASWELNKLNEDSSQEGIVSKITQDGKERGEIKFDISFFPVLKPAIVDGKPEPIPETSIGVVRLVLHQAKELDPSKNAISKDINSFAKLFVNDKFIHSTPVGKHTLKPIWESPKEFLCADRANCIVTIKVIDDRDFLKDPVIGYLNVKLEDMLQAKKEGRDWFTLSGCQSGRVRISAEWKPLDMEGSLHGAAKYVPPIGVVRVLMKKAVDIKNVEGGLGGKSDPYVRVMINNTIMTRTEVINNNLNPVWDQYMYIPVHSLRETLYFECMDYQHLTKDRPLGHVELDVAKLAEVVPPEDPVSEKYPYQSLGVKDMKEPIKVDNGTKGELYFSAEFVPALHLAGVSFGGQKNAIEAAVGTDHDDEGDQDVPKDLTYETGKKINGAAGAAAGVDGAAPEAPKEANGNGHAKVGDDGFKMTKDQILASPSGVIVFDIVSGHIAKKGRLEILMDDGYWPVFTTEKARTTSPKWDMVGEGFIKELDFGRVWLRLNTNGEGEKEDIIAEFKQDAKPFLAKALDGPTPFVLTDVDEENQSTVIIAAKFVPVPITLSDQESMSNQGNLRVEIIDGGEIHGADRSGTSDPYVVASLNGEKLHKTEVKKKTLTPVWNEQFECTVPSRVGADMMLEVFDWDRVGNNQSIGKAKVDLAALVPLVGTEQTLPLHSSKHGQKGFVRVHLMFTPGIVAKSRKNTSTFSTAGRAVTQVGSAPLLVGKGVVGGVGAAGKGVAGGVSSVGKGVKGIFGGKKSSDVGDGAVPPTPATASTVSPPNTAGLSLIQEPPSTQIVEPIPGAPAVPGYSVANNSQTFPSTSNGGSLEGTLRVIVQNAKDVADSDGDQVRPYVVLTMGGKEVKTKHVGKTNNPEWDESFTFAVGPETKSLHLEVMDHHTIGKDKCIGQTDISIWEKLNPTGSEPVSAAIVSSELRNGVGQLAVRLEFESSPGGLAARAASIGSVASLERPAIGSPSRFSMRKAKSPLAD